MTRLASAALMPLADAVSRLTQAVAPVPERVLPPGAALGAAVACNVTAGRALPARATALRDGWAVEAERVTGASPYGPVLLTPAPAWIEAGDPMPEGTDTVLPAEALAGHSAVADAPTGDGVRRASEDLGPDAVILAAGERLAPRHLLALAGAGVTSVPVRIPRLALIATGSSAVLLPVLRTLAAAEGAEIMELSVPDEAEAIAKAIRAATADAVFVLGGTGPGRTDRSVAGLALAGEILAHGIALRPGETAAIGRCEERPVLLIPGRPEAALAVFLALGRPLLAVLAGALPEAPQAAALLRKVTATIGLSDVVFVRRNGEHIDPLGGVELPLWRLAEANGAILIGPEREGHPEGTILKVLPL